MLIIFDCDGVLVDSEPLAARVLERYLRDLDYPLIVEESAHGRFLGFTLQNVRRDLEVETGTALPDDFEEELRRRDQIAFEGDLTAIPGVAEVVANLSHAYCIASSGPPAKIRNSLTLTGLLEQFDPHLFSAHDPGVAKGKPAPDLFLYAAQSMGVDAADCLVIEDSVAGVTAGKAAKMRTLGFNGGGHCGPGYGDMLMDAGADGVFSDMRELPKLL